MRVLHLTTEFPPVIYGGLGTAVGGWVEASARAGISVAVELVEGPLMLDARSYGYGSPNRLARVKAEKAAQDANGVVFFQSSWSDAIEVGIRAVTDWHADIVHLHTAMLWYVARAIQSATGTPIVYHVHSVDKAEYEIGNEPNPWLAHSRAQEEAIEGSDRLIALTRSERDLLVHYYPNVRSKIRLVGNGIEDTDKARTIAYNRSPRSRPIILYSGRLVERKGIRELLSAIPKVLEEYPEILFVFAGGPPPLTGAEVAEQWLEQAHTQFRNRIHFTGWLSPRDLSIWYEAADVLVVPSRYEPFGMVILEGMLYGLPIIAAKVGGPAEIIEHGRTGLLFPACDASALASSLKRLLENPSERRQLGEAAAHEVRHRWSWEHLTQQMFATYTEVDRIKLKAS